MRGKLRMPESDRMARLKLRLELALLVASLLLALEKLLGP